MASSENMGGHQRTFMTLSRTCRGSGQVELSAERFQELLQAEVINLADHYKTITYSNALRDLISMQQGHESKLMRARKLNNEMSVHFGFRINLIDKHQHIFAHSACFQKLRQVYVETFTHMQTQVASSLEEEDLGKFDQVMLDLRRRHMDVIPLLVSSLRDVQSPEMEYESEVEELLPQFFRSRIYTEMLTRQYFSVSKVFISVTTEELFPPQKPLDESFSYGIAMDVLVKDLVEAAFKRAHEHTSKFYSAEESPNIGFEVDGDLELRAQTLPLYVYYILNEFAKNSFLVSYKVHSEHPIRITLCSDDKMVTIRIQDRGGGLLKGVTIDDIWRLGFTTAELKVEADGTMHKHMIPSKYVRSPMAGVGCGLPLARKYAQFLGGSVDFFSLPNFGSDVYFSFRKNVTEMI